MSAKQRTGLDELLEKILLQSEVLELKSNPNRSAEGVVIEASMKKGLGETGLTRGGVKLSSTNHSHTQCLLTLLVKSQKVYGASV